MWLQLPDWIWNPYAGEDDHDRRDADGEADLPLGQSDLPRQRGDDGVEALTATG